MKQTRETVPDGTWFGQKIGELTREEMYDVIAFLMNDIAETNEKHAQTLRFMEIRRKARMIG